MITDQLNTGLISAMKEKLPQGTNLANLLMDILYIGKEAVYRRLRGEVPFTLAEAAVISQKIGISLDRITGTTFRGNALFDLNLTHYDNPIETYYGIIEHYAKIFSVIKEEPESELNTSSNIIPQTIYLKYPLLSKFRMFKWIYQHSQQNNTQCYEQLELPDKLLDRQREFVSETQFVRNTYYILDSMVFRYLTNDIRYFIDSHLITDENVRNLREELLELVDELEHIATVGAFETGREVQFYVSNINFEATYSYVESQQHCLSLIRVFAINSITSIDPEVFKQVKEWIQSLKKFSTLITNSEKSSAPSEPDTYHCRATHSKSCCEFCHNPRRCTPGFRFSGPQPTPPPESESPPKSQTPTAQQFSGKETTSLQRGEESFTHPASDAENAPRQGII